MEEPARRVTRCLVIVNPAAGGVTPALVQQVTAVCRSYGADPCVHRTTGAGAVADELAELLAKGTVGWPDLMLAMGGDGTVRDVADALVRLAAAPETTGGRALPALVVVPAGSGNSYHRALWADRPWREVLREVLAGSARARRVDLARVAEDGRTVLIGASSGLIADITRTALDLGHISGRERYLTAMSKVRITDYTPYPGRVVVDGEVLFEGPTVLATVGGVRHRVGTIPVLPTSLLDDGLLDVCVIDGRLTPPERDDISTHIRAGTHVGRHGVAYGRGRTVAIERTDGRPLIFEHDGDVWSRGLSTATVEILPRAMSVLAPPEPVAG
jgi:diacylglycerol kinase (ATP)